MKNEEYFYKYFYWVFKVKAINQGAHHRLWNVLTELFIYFHCSTLHCYIAVNISEAKNFITWQLFVLFSGDGSDGCTRIGLKSLFRTDLADPSRFAVQLRVLPSLHRRLAPRPDHRSPEGASRILALFCPKPEAARQSGQPRQEDVAASSFWRGGQRVRVNWNFWLLVLVCSRGLRKGEHFTFK